MKKIKLIISCAMVLVVALSVFCFLNKEDYSYYLVMGDYVSKSQIVNEKKIDSFSSLVGEFLLNENKVNEVNAGYLKNNMTSKKMLEMIENETYKKDSKDLETLIKKSKYISITLGINDIINNIKYDSNNKKIIYDKEIINNKIEIFKHNYYKIVEEIKDINKDATILLVGSYKVYGDDELNVLLNEAIKSVAIESNAYYVDISDINDRYVYQENELYLTSFGHEKICQKVISLLKEIEKV